MFEARNIDEYDHGQEIVLSHINYISMLATLNGRYRFCFALKET